MNFPGPALLSRSQTLSEEELMQSFDTKGVVVRLGMAFAAFAVLILYLEAAYDDRKERPQAIAAEHIAREQHGRSY
jgi:hypothetical protein